MGLSLVGVMIMAGSLNLNDIVKAQRDSIYGMYVIPQFIAFVIFTIAAVAVPATIAQRTPKTPRPVNLGRTRPAALEPATCLTT
jgi:NADH:ubiquinone oxidoreductase subunit H